MVVALESEAYAQLKAVTKVSPSDVVSDALTQWIEEWIRKHGPLPYEAADRPEYVSRLADSLRASLRAELDHH